MTPLHSSEAWDAFGYALRPTVAFVRIANVTSDVRYLQAVATGSAILVINNIKKASYKKKACTAPSPLDAEAYTPCERPIEFGRAIWVLRPLAT